MSAQGETNFTLEREIERTKTEKSGEKLETRKEGKGEGEGVKSDPDKSSLC